MEERSRQVRGESTCQIDKLNLPGNRAQVQPRNGYRQLKPSGARASGIDVEDAGALAASKLMRVSADDHLESGRFSNQIELMDVVQHVDVHRASFDDRRCRERGRPR